MQPVVFQGTHHEVGEQIGEHYRANIVDWVRLHGAWDMPGLTRERVVRECDRIFDLLGSIAPTLCQELDGISEGADLPLELILRDSDRGPLLIKNHDSLLADKHFYHLQHRIYDGGPSMLCVTYGGTIWAQGINSLGLATGGSSVRPRESDEYRLGLPDAVISRLLLECAGSVDEACALFEETPYMGKGCNYAVCDAAGEGAILEGSKSRKVILRMDGDHIHCTNFYASGQIEHASKPEYLDNARGRTELLDRYLADDPARTVARSIEIMSSHDGPVSLCRHAADDGTHNDTLMTHVALPAEGAMLFADTFPCEAQWAEYAV